MGGWFRCYRSITQGLDSSSEDRAFIIEGAVIFEVGKIPGHLHYVEFFGIYMEPLLLVIQLVFPRKGPNFAGISLSFI